MVRGKLASRYLAIFIHMGEIPETVENIFISKYTHRCRISNHFRTKDKMKTINAKIIQDINYNYYQLKFSIARRNVVYDSLKPCCFIRYKRGFTYYLFEKSKSEMSQPFSFPVFEKAQVHISIYPNPIDINF